MIPGEYLLASDPIIANVGHETVTLLVRHTGDRPIQVGSHYHFFEVNRALEFDREKARGMRLNVAAGTGMRFEPGEEKPVPLVAFGGLRRIFGHQGKINGELGVKS
jgi:urease beta subunit